MIGSKKKVKDAYCLLLIVAEGNKTLGCRRHDVTVGRNGSGVSGALTINMALLLPSTSLQAFAVV